MNSLHYACINGDIDYIKNNISKTNINEKNEFDNTPFIFACCYARKEIVEFFLKADGFNSLNEKNDHSYTPFIIVCRDGHKEIVELLLRANGFNSLNEKHNDGDTPILKACWNGHIEIVKLLLKQPDIIIPENMMYFENKNKIELLIELYKKDPQTTRARLILDDNLDIYRHIVFVCDGYFTIKETDSTNKDVRFMKILSRLPLELQSLLIHRLSGSIKQNITGKIFSDNLGNYIRKYMNG
jgi:ankyrin repeat protein